jgi:hypothetical protein
MKYEANIRGGGETFHVVFKNIYTEAQLFQKGVGVTGDGRAEVTLPSPQPFFPGPVFVNV